MTELWNEVAESSKEPQYDGKPNSVRLDPPAFACANDDGLQRDDHSSRPTIAGWLKQPTRKSRTGRPLTLARRRALAGASAGGDASLFGFAPCRVLPATRLTASAVRSYRTFSPLPLDSAFRPRLGAVYFLCHYPSSYPDRALPGALPYGVRTFLPPSSALAGFGETAVVCRTAAKCQRTR